MGQIGSGYWLLFLWGFSGFLTLLAALSYGELAGMMPQAGGQFVYIKKAYGNLPSFLYGWTVFSVIQTGVIAAGCDSFMTIILTILSPSASEITMEACDSFSLPGGTQTWTKSGIYVDTIPNAVGCVEGYN